MYEWCFTILNWLCCCIVLSISMDVYRCLKTPTFTSFAQDDFSDYLKAMFHNFVYTCRRIKQKHFKQKRFWKTGYMYFHIQKAVHMYMGRYTEEESALHETRITSPESRGMSVNHGVKRWDKPTWGHLFFSSLIFVGKFGHWNVSKVLIFFTYCHQWSWKTRTNVRKMLIVKC